jgi:predicted Ser/Thr protein kinase
VNSITPLEKARLLSKGILPSRLSSDEKKNLRSFLDEIREEYASVPYYEGRIGPSPREMKIILFNALERSEKGILSPLGLFTELEEFVKRTSEYDYLREDVVEGYHDVRHFIQTVRDVYLEDLDGEVRSCLGVHDEKQYEGFLRKYIVNVTAYLKKEKIRNPVTGKSEESDAVLMEEFEKVVGAESDRDGFRQNIMTQLGVYALEHPGSGGEGIDYAKVFPDLMKRIRDFYIDEHSQLLKRVYDAITLFEQSAGGAAIPEGRTRAAPEGRIRTVEQIEAEKLALSMVENMKKKYGYSDASAREAFVHLVQKKY